MQQQTPRVLFSQIGVDGQSEYTRGDWRKVAIHNSKEIRGFFGPYEWLSNTHRSEVFYFGMKFPSAENAYQATKVFPSERPRFQTCSPFEAMKLGDSLPAVDPLSWPTRKLDSMRTILFSKFHESPELARRLLATGNAHLEERLWWRDTFWGYDVNLKAGENHMGRLLMTVREELQRRARCADQDLSNVRVPRHW
jgi:predicted NAD-dependent protein-ADP-ribosyltransferase YbiA (DUF1768 family)